MNKIPPKEILDVFRSSLEYKGGKLFWKTSIGNRAKIGEEAGYFIRLKYRVIEVKRKPYYSHRIIWYLIHNEWPILNIDHIDGNPENNLVENLRLCNQSLNCANKKSKRKYKSVYQNPKGRWYSKICKDYKSIHLGTFDTPEAAAEAYNVKAKELFGDFSKLNEVRLQC